LKKENNGALDCAMFAKFLDVYFANGDHLLLDMRNNFRSERKTNANATNYANTDSTDSTSRGC
jgi:hypothetical protein